MKSIERLKALVHSGNLTGGALSVSTNGKLVGDEAALAIGQKVLERVENEEFDRLTVQRVANQTRITLAEQDDYYILAMAD